MKPSVLTYLLVCLLLFCYGAFAQSSIHVISTFSEPGKPMLPECGHQLEVFERLLNSYPHPAQWSYYIACDDAVWHRTLTHEGIPENGLVHYGETSLKGRMTMLRGWTLTHPDSPHVPPERVIAHELAHIALWSRDEERVEHQADLWLKARVAPASPVPPRPAPAPGETLLAER